MQRRYIGNFGDGPAPAQLPAAIASGVPGQGGLATAIANPLGDILDPQVDGSDYFFYQTTVASMAPAANSPSQIQIDAGTDFLWIASTYFVSGIGTFAGDALVNSEIIIPLLTVTILDTGATKNLMNAPCPISSIASYDASFPYRLIRPRLFRANSVINFTWINNATDATYVGIYLIMHGIRKIAGSFNLA